MLALAIKYWKIAAGVIVAVAIAIWRGMLISEGRRREQMAQAERNRRVKEKADVARDDALRSDDPHGELRRDFGSDRK